MSWPRTRAEAEGQRIGQWAGNERGVAFDSKRCAAVLYGNWIAAQCMRKPKYGPDNLYCGQHARMLEQRAAR